MPKPLMPKATAVWLIENTALTFDQVADFCSLHPLEVQVPSAQRFREPLSTSHVQRLVDLTAADELDLITDECRRRQAEADHEHGEHGAENSKRRACP